MSNITPLHPDRMEAIGAAIGVDLLDNLLKATTQAEAFRAFALSLHALLELPGHPQQAAIGGYAGALVNVLEIGIQHLPRLTPEEEQELQELQGQ